MENSFDTESLLQKGIAFAEKKDYQTAIATLDRAIALNPQSAEAYYQRGQARYHSGSREAAIADYDLSLNLNPRQVNVYLSRAKAFFELNSLQSSIIDLQVALNFDPNCDRAYKLWANVCIRMKEYNRAIDCLKQAGKIYLDRQDRESCRFCIARIRQLERHQSAERGEVTNREFLQQIRQKINRGQLKEAFDDCSWLLQLDPYDAEAYECRGTISIELGKGDRGRQDLYQAARYYRTQGNLVEAERIERRCLELQLNNAF